jgi:hypothetical protein
MARPSIYEKWEERGQLDEVLSQVAKMTAKGMPEARIAAALNISYASLKKCKKEHFDFAQAFRNRKLAVNEIENAMMRRAVGYDKDEKHYPPNVPAATLLLKAWAPEIYRDKPVEKDNSNDKIDEFHKKIDEMIDKYLDEDDEDDTDADVIDDG